MDTKLVIDFLTKLGEQISTTGKEVFEVYTKQAYVTGVADLILGFVLLIAFGFLVKGAIWAYKENEESWLWGFNIFNFFVIIIMLGSFYNGTKEMINPQYYAIQDLVRSLSGK